MTVLLDTFVLIDHLRGQEEADVPRALRPPY